MRRIAVAVLLAALFVLSASPVAGAKATSVGISQSPACTFNLTYTWSGFGGRDNLTSNVGLYDGSTLVGYDPDPAAGTGGTNTFTIEATSSGSFTAVGWLTDKNGRTVAGSTRTSEAIAASCAPTTTATGTNQFGVGLGTSTFSVVLTSPCPFAATGGLNGRLEFTTNHVEDGVIVAASAPVAGVQQITLASVLVTVHPAGEVLSQTVANCAL